MLHPFTQLWSVARPRAHDFLRCGAAVVAVLLSTMIAGCDSSPTPIPPVSPNVKLATPAGLAGGVLPTATVTPGPSPTPIPISTHVTPPPEPLRLPSRFGIGVYGETLPGARMMAFAPTGELFVTVPHLDLILVLPDRDSDGVAEDVLVYAQGGQLNKPNGIAFHDGELWVANTDGLIRFPYNMGDVQASGEADTFIALPGEGLHALHSLAIEPDGTIYVGVGSSCDACVEEDGRRASILRFASDGSEAVIHATGLRNPAGIAVDPSTGAVWVTDSGREGLGQFLPPEELNRLNVGADYGWPFCIGDRVPDPMMGGTREQCASTVGPAIELLAHSAPSGLAFYEGEAFPSMYEGGVFVALHGSFDEYLPTGVSVIFLPFQEGMPTGEVVGFVDGWLQPDTRRWAVPADVVMAPDGTLFVSDEGAGRVFRVYYGGPRATATPYP